MTTETFTVTTTLPTELVEGVAALLGWDETGTAKDFVLNILAPKIKDAIGEIMITPAREHYAAQVRSAALELRAKEADLATQKQQLLPAIDVS